MNAPFSWHHLNEWHFGVLALVLLVGAGVLYWIGSTHVNAWPRIRTVCFALGLVVTFIATESFIGVYDMEYFTDHMIQHLMLIMVAAPLFALSAPLDLAYQSAGRAVRRVLDSKVMAAITHPLFAFALYFVFIPFTHLTSFMNVMMEHPWIQYVEQISFLLVGYLFFRAAFGLERGNKIHPGLRILYVMAAVPVDTFTGLVLNLTKKNPFSSYPRMAPAGSTPQWILNNIHYGGAIMWIGGDGLMLIACIPIAIMWVKWENVRTKELDAELDLQGL